ncbi:TPA: SDR family NAD(P)-dependent oxidoreductase, partial [Serratia marcescens]|nr:SDR family NAD(P)-dependent oxidoreductase [Serratia marcescens]
YPALAEQLHLEPPQFADEAEQDERLVDGNRICNELGFEYQYPDPARMPVS